MVLIMSLQETSLLLLVCLERSALWRLTALQSEWRENDVEEIVLGHSFGFVPRMMQSPICVFVNLSGREFAKSFGPARLRKRSYDIVPGYTAQFVSSYTQPLIYWY